MKPTLLKPKFLAGTFAALAFGSLIATALTLVATPAAAATAVDPCALLTRAEVKQVLGAPVKPPSGYTGSDSFTWKANDGVADSNTATVTVTVKAANHPPVASNGTLTANENTAASGTLVATDADGDALTFSIVTKPGHGSVTISDANKGTYTYTPTSGYSGSDSFTFKANDGLADSNTATVTVTVSAAAPPPPPPSGGGGGGGSFGPFALLGLLLLVVPWWLRHSAAKLRSYRRLRAIAAKAAPTKEGIPMKPRFLMAACAALMLGFAALPALANPGDVDTNFNGGVPVIDDGNPSRFVYTAAIDPLNGDIFWAGAYGSAGDIFASKPDGSYDTSFGGTGGTGAIIFGAAERFDAIAVDGQGRILAAGAQDPSTMILMRLNPDGSFDTSFGAAGTGIVTDALNGIATATGLSLTADGHILVTGEAYDSSGSQEELTVWRFNADGTPDTGFGDNGHVQIAGIHNSSDMGSCFPALQPDGMLIVGCEVTTTYVGPWMITRLKVDGSVDTSFGASGFITGDANMFLAGLALAPDGGFIISELDLSASPNAVDLRRFLANGTVDPDFNGGNPEALVAVAYASPIPVAVQPDGKMLVSENGGSFVTTSSIIIIRFLPDGSIDNSFGNAPPGSPINLSAIDFSSIGGITYTPYPMALLVQGDGRIVAAGYADSSAGSEEASFVTRVLSDTYDLDPAAPSFDKPPPTPLGEAVVSNATNVSGVSIGGSSSGVHVALATQNGKYSTTGTSGPFAGSFTGVNAAWVSPAESIALEQMTSTTGGTDTTTNVVLGGFWAANNYEIPLGTVQTTSWTTTTDQPPVASNGTLTATSGKAASSTLSATNPSGGTLAFAIVTPPSHGTAAVTNAATGAYTYTSASGYTGSDSFTWKANDGVADSNTATVTVTVKAANHPPVASDGTLSTDENTPTSGTLIATDADGDALTFSIVAQPTHGSVTITDASKGTYTYTPATGYSGTDSFTFKANDGVADSNTATVTVTVSAAATPPPPSGGGGGGGFGPLALLALLVCAVALRWRKCWSLSARLKSATRTWRPIAMLALCLLAALPALATAQWKHVSQGVWLNDIAYGAARRVHRQHLTRTQNRKCSMDHSFLRMPSTAIAASVSASRRAGKAAQPRAHADRVGPSRINTRPTHTPVKASAPPSQAASNDFGPVWGATPSPYDFFIHYTTPV